MPDCIMAAPPSEANCEAVTGLKELEKAESTFKS